MRVPIVIFIIGVIMLIGGIILALVAPAIVAWQHKSEVLASEAILEVSAGWLSQSEVLADKESMSASAVWKSRNETLIDEVITVDYVTPDQEPVIFGEAKDFVVAGTATEQSPYPKPLFNFYVFDSANYYLWEAGEPYVAYYEAEGKTSLSFSFSLATAEEVPDTFYFVVEEYEIGVRPIVRVTATISWSEKSPRYDYTDYYWAFGASIYEESKNIVLKGTATEADNEKFNFCIFNSTNYSNWYAGEAYTTYYEESNVSSATFSITLTEDQATFPIYFAIENPNTDTDVTVTLSATVEWVEKAYDCSEYFMGWATELIIEEAKDFTLTGSATEVADREFNFYILDSTNYFNWIDGEAYTAYYEEQNVTTTSFSIPVTKDEAMSMFYFVVENPLIDTSETVNLSANIEWNEKATIATTIVGLVLGGAIALLGLVVMIIAGVAALVSQPKPPALPTRMCPQCGRKVFADLRFCPYCGKALK